MEELPSNEERIPTENAKEIKDYTFFFGKNGLTAFRDRVLPLAQHILGGGTNLYKDTISTLTNVAANEIMPTQLTDFWSKEISEDTFQFQKQYEELIKPSTIHPDPLTFHINNKKLLEHDISTGLLIPEYIRTGRAYNDEIDTDTIYFASGTVDELAKFLTGFALISHSVDYDNKTLRNPNSLQFAKTLSIAVTDTKKNNMKFIPKGHDMMTLYSSFESGNVDLNISTEPVPFKSIQIPITVLLPSQIETLREEGKQLFRDKRFSTDHQNLKSRTTDENQAGDIYAFSRHCELAVKFALLKYIESYKG